MKHKQIPLAGIKTSGLGEGQFEGFASVFDHLDSQGDIVRRGAFAKSIQGGTVVPLIWEHQSKDPRAFVGEVKSAEETSEGLRIVGQFDMDTEAGQAAYRQVKARRVGALSIGYIVTQQRKNAEGANELTDLDLLEISVVSRPANDRALIGAVKSDNGGNTSAIVLARKALANIAAEEGAPEETEDPAETWGDKILRLLAEATDAAQALIEAAEGDGRDLSAEETSEVVKCLDRASGWKAEVQKWADATPQSRWSDEYHRRVVSHKSTEAEFVAKFGEQANPAPALVNFDASAANIKSRKANHTKEIQVDNTDKYISIGSGRKAAAAAIVTKMTGGHRAPGDIITTGTKALTSSGQIVTDVPVLPTVVPTGRPAVSLLDVIPSNRLSAPTYRYIRQASRALAAAAVAPGEVKPTSAVGTQTIDNTVSVVAHLSEALDKFVLSDAPQLQRFVADELLYGLDVAIQAQALNGSGTAPNQTGILNTSGVSVQAFATNVLTSVRKAITSAETLGYAPSVLVISPADWEALELLATTDAAL